jgi:hypothetical protein
MRKAGASKKGPGVGTRAGESNWYGGDMHATHQAHGSHPSTVKEGIKSSGKAKDPLVRKNTGTENHLKH